MAEPAVADAHADFARARFDDVHIVVHDERLSGRFEYGCAHGITLH
jgi:hypothetical protein